MTAREWYFEDETGVEWGPFSDEERADMRTPNDVGRWILRAGVDR